MCIFCLIQNITKNQFLYFNVQLYFFILGLWFEPKLPCIGLSNLNLNIINISIKYYLCSSPNKLLASIFVKIILIFQWGQLLSRWLYWWQNLVLSSQYNISLPRQLCAHRSWERSKNMLKSLVVRHFVQPISAHVFRLTYQVDAPRKKCKGWISIKTSEAALKELRKLREKRFFSIFLFL